MIRSFRYLTIAAVVYVMLAGASAAEEPVRLTGSRPPKVIEWTQELRIPDDLLYSRHVYYGEKRLVFEVSLDSSGRVQRLRPITGFSLYLAAFEDQLKGWNFGKELSNSTIVVRTADPFVRVLSGSRAEAATACTPLASDRTLYQAGAVLWRDQDNSAAKRCYQYLLKRNPSSVAARWGMADICLSEKAQCAVEYLSDLVASHPEFIEAQRRLAGYPKSKDYAAKLDKILSLEMPLYDRLSLFTDEIYALDEQRKFSEEADVIRKWNALAPELFAIYPQLLYGGEIPASHFALVLEGLGATPDALSTYRIAAAAAKQNPLKAPIAIYQIDMGLARTLRRTGRDEEAGALCSAWRTKWKKLIEPPARHSWERRDNGPNELQARWEFSCGNPELGLRLIEASISKSPDSGGAYEVLSQYYYSQGDIQKGREADDTAYNLQQQWGRRAISF